MASNNTAAATQLADALKEIRRLRGEITKLMQAKWQLQADMEALRKATAEERECELMAEIGQLHERIEGLEERLAMQPQKLSKLLSDLLGEHAAMIGNEFTDALREDADDAPASSEPKPVIVPNGGRVKLRKADVLALQDGAHAWAKLSRLEPIEPVIVDEGPVTLTIRYSDVDNERRRIPTDQPWRMCLLELRNVDWPPYNPSRDLQSDGSLVAEEYKLELYRDE